MSNVAYYLKTRGLSFVIKEAISRVFFRILKLKYSAKDLQNIIVMESHNDFDCNCGAFFTYLIDKGLNQDYKIVWLVKNKVNVTLPQNVTAIKLDKLSFRKNYYLCRAKIILYEDRTVPRIWENQIVIYCTHGGITFKNVKGHLKVVDDISYVLSPSSNYDPLMCENYSIPYPNNKMLHLGYPSNDSLFEKENHEVAKLTPKHFRKNVLWMPTFRKSKSGRNDSDSNQPLGIPLFESAEQLFAFDKKLNETDTLLVIKFHPMQDLSQVRLPENLHNIIFITAESTKKLDLDAYRLMGCMDAMIGDYSSAAYSFLMLNRPIGFVLSDLDAYKPGLTYESVAGMDVLPGEKIRSIGDLELFITNLANQVDRFAEDRARLAGWLYEDLDGKASERLAEFLQLGSGKETNTELYGRNEE